MEATPGFTAPARIGLMVVSERDFLRVAPYIATLPGIAIMLAVLGFSLLGDGLRDALAPWLRGNYEWIR